MKTCIFVYNIANVKFDTNKLYDPKKHRFILIANQERIANLAKHYRQSFAEIIAVDTIDFSTLNTLLQKFLQQYPHSKIQLMTDDESCMLICAQLRDKYHLSGPSAKIILPFVDKIAMKDKLSTSKIRQPKYLHFDYVSYKKNSTQYIEAVGNYLNYPLFLKPTSSYGSVNALKLKTENELMKALSDISKTNEDYEIDEFIDGDLYHCDGIVKDQNIVIFFANRYNTPCVNFTKGVPLGSLILLDNDPLKEKLRAFTQTCVSALDTPDGAFHLEAFVNRAGEIIFLEIGARAPGALVIPTYDTMYGINLEEQHFRLQLNQTHREVLPRLNNMPLGYHFQCVKAALKALTTVKLIL